MIAELVLWQLAFCTPEPRTTAWQHYAVCSQEALPIDIARRHYGDDARELFACATGTAEGCDTGATYYMIRTCEQYHVVDDDCYSWLKKKESDL